MDAALLTVTWVVDTSEEVRKVLNQLEVEPLNSRMSISGGQEVAPVSQKAGQVPRTVGALTEGCYAW